MHGNVTEWCWDELGGSTRVRRGGGWGFVAASCRAAHRDAFKPTTRTVATGFRITTSPIVVSPEAAKSLEPLGRKW